jgi:hypothetical protein
MALLVGQCAQGGTPARPELAPPDLVATPVQRALAPNGMPMASDWEQAPAVQLTQQDPRPGEPTPYSSEVRVLTDRLHLYVRVNCVDPDFGQRSIHTLARDSDQTSDDHVTIVLDTFGNHRVGYVFQVNAGGARTDGLLSPASPDPAYDWDGVWDARVQRVADGWNVEFAIDAPQPVPQGLQRWGATCPYVPRAQLQVAVGEYQPGRLSLRSRPHQGTWRCWRFRARPWS